MLNFIHKIFNRQIYTLTKDDKKFIKMMERDFDMNPTFYKNGLFIYDSKSNPGFNDAILD